MAKECRVCVESGPRLYVHARRDGPGATVHNLIYALAIAARHEMRFGGAISSAPTHFFKGIDVADFAAKALGFSDPKTFLTPPSVAPALNFSSVFEFEEYVKKKHGGGAPDRDAILSTSHMIKKQGLEGVKKKRPHTRLDEYLTKDFLKKLRGCRPPWMNSTTRIRAPATTPPLRVVMHARRGDREGTPDAEFFRVARFIKHLVRDAELSVYSLPEGFNESAFRREDFTPHVDTMKANNEHLLFEVWTTFATADVLLVDTSSFSWAPAFFNPRCVLYHPYRLAYPEDRLALGSWVPSTDLDRVRHCVADLILQKKTNQQNQRWWREQRKNQEEEEEECG